MTVDIVEFVQARVAEDEQVALAVDRAGWLETTRTGHMADWHPTELAHARLHGPARVLREVAATRAVLADHQHLRFAELPRYWPDHWKADAREAFPGTPKPYVGCQICDENHDYQEVEPDWWCKTVRCLATIWSEHPDFQPEWSQP